MEPLILLVIFFSFFTTFIALPYWIRGAKKHGHVSKDMHKVSDKLVAECGGISAAVGICAGILLYIAINTFVFENSLGWLVELFAILSVLLIATIVGIIDDLLGWKAGLSKRFRILVILFAAIPLMAINAGESTMLIPFFGEINFGLLFPLLIIPFGVIGATATYNFLAGYNGLEASQGIIILSAMAWVTYVTGSRELTVVCLLTISSLIAFYIFNKHPAEVFPGDVLTYPIGALIASIAILGNMEKIAVFFFIPYIIEFFLKVRGKLKKESFAKLNHDGSLEMPYEKFYGLEHVAIFVLQKTKPSGKAYEKEVVYLINFFQILIVWLGLWLFLP